MDKPFENTFDVKYDEKGIETFNRWQDPTINELQQQLDKYKSTIDKIKEETKLAYNELQPGELVIGQALLKNILELLEDKYE